MIVIISITHNIINIIHPQPHRNNRNANRKKKYANNNLNVYPSQNIKTLIKIQGIRNKK